MTQGTGYDGGAEGDAPLDVVKPQLEARVRGLR